MFPERAALKVPNHCPKKKVYLRSIQTQFNKQNKKVIKQHPVLCKAAAVSQGKTSTP